MSIFKKFVPYKKAFTLAEVLITLGIIGVVAALTIPILSQNANERATVSQLKEVYSILSQAYKLAEKDNGTPDTWGMTVGNSPQVLSMLVPYLKVAQDCTDSSPGCFPSGVMYIYLAASKGNAGGYSSDNYPKIKLANGTIVMGRVASTTCSIVTGTSLALSNMCARYWVDVNGEKGPNQWGKDTFAFYLTKYGIVPYGSQQDSAYMFWNTCSDKDTVDGTGCAGWVIYNENMDYLHCNTLGWGVKTTCN